jgi:peptide-methionine (S)-S-oxide reductase
MSESKIEEATLGGGCFWCVEAVFLAQPGVSSVKSGYSGGHKDNPTYKEVCAGTTGHAEVCRIQFDPSKTSFGSLLDVFFHAHDPTTLNRQGNDVGTQYRSVIFYHSEEQKRVAEERKIAAQKDWPSPIVTEISPLTNYFEAEDYHQNYFALHKEAPYCSYVIAPKLKKLGIAF